MNSSVKRLVLISDKLIFRNFSIFTNSGRKILFSLHTLPWMPHNVFINVRRSQRLPPGLYASRVSFEVKN